MRPQQQFSMIFDGNFAFFQFFVNLACYSMGILHFFHFSSIFHVIQWEICIFLLFCKFSMLFNGKIAFCQFSMLFNGNLRLERLRGGTYGQTDRRMDGRTYGRMDGRKEIHPCVLQDIGPLGPLPKKCNRLLKGNMWSAVPDALLGVIS